MKTLIFVLFTLFATVPGMSEITGEKPTNEKFVVTGKACYYASKFHGRRTTSGEVFNNDKFSAAHLSLPFGTVVKVTNLANGKSVKVKINDRGPHSKVFIIDLSQAAAKEIGIFKYGVGNVELSYELGD